VGENFWVSLSSETPLPDGAYAVEVLVEHRPMFSVTVSVGSGTGAITAEQGETEGVEISGVVVDAVTGKGVAGALVAVLDVDLESAEFTYSESEIYTTAISDREGRFALARSLQRGRFYTVYVFAEDYITIVEDNFTIPRDQRSPTDIVIELSRP
jgi:hypothetical protein